MLNAQQERIQNELDALTMERQWIITQARKGGITESDMDYQLGALTLQELSLKREYTSIGQAINIHAPGDWESKVKEYLANLQAGLESLNAKPKSDEDAWEILEIKRQTVNTLVRRVTIDRNRKLHVEISLDLRNFVNDDRSNKLEGQNKNKIKPAGIHPGWRDDS